MSEPFNAGTYFLDRHVEAGDGGRTAVRCQGATTTYAGLRDLSAAFARGLRDLGTRTGERVLFVCSDRTELLAGILGAMRTGAVAVPVSTMLTGPELAKVVVDSGARVLVVSPEFVPAVQVAAAAAPELAHVVGVAGAAPDAARGAGPHRPGTSWSPPAATRCAPRPSDTPALWLYTSGTTGTPKGAMHRHENLRAVCETYAPAGPAASPATTSASRSPSCSSPTGWATPRCSRSGPARRRCSSRAGRRRGRRRGGRASTGRRCSSPARPSSPRCSPPTCRPTRSPRCGCVPSAGEALPATLHRRFTERFGVEVLDGIGSTEALHIFLSNRPGRRSGPAPPGTAVPGYDALAARRRRARGARRRARARCSSAATRSRPATGAAPTPPAHGVRGRVAADRRHLRPLARRLLHLPRAAPATCSRPAASGSRPPRWRTGCCSTPAVAEAAVVGVPDRDDLDKPVACVVPGAGAALDADELIAWCRDGLAAFKRPRSVLVLTSCRRPRPARCSASGCARTRRPPRAGCRRSRRRRR